MADLRDQRGFIAVTVAFLLIGMVGFAALAVDTGFLYSSRTNSQGIADAAALAGAASFIFSPNAIQPQAAIDRAVATAVAQSVMADPVQPSEVTVNVDVPNRLVTVTLNRSEPTFFGQVLGLDHAPVTVTGSAEAARNASGSGCPKPWFLPNAILLDTSECDGLKKKDEEECIAAKFCAQCTNPIDPATTELLAYRDPVTWDIVVPPSAQTLLASAPLIDIRPINPHDALAPGNFYSLRLGDSRGGSDYRTNIATCSNEVGACGSCYDTEPGNMVGPTRQGVEDLLADPPHRMFVLADGSYCFGASATDCSVNGSQQLVTVPVWDLCNTPGLGACPAESFCPNGKFNGLVSLRVIAFATVFVEGWSGSDLRGRLLGIEPCSYDASPMVDPDGNVQTGPLGVPLRLVSTANL